MKIRSGFVSNSSSASFVITWQYAWSDEYPKLYRIISDILYPYLDMETDAKIIRLRQLDIAKILEITKEIENPSAFVNTEEGTESRIKDLEEQTVTTIFETSSWTSMFNDANDFDPSFVRFLFALETEMANNYGSRRIKIINKRIESNR